MTRDADTAQDLYGEILGAICKETGLREDMARPFATAVVSFLQANWGGRRLYVPMPERRYPELEIAAYYEKARAEEAAGGPSAVQATCRKFVIGKTKLFEILKPCLPEGPDKNANR